MKANTGSRPEFPVDFRNKHSETCSKYTICVRDEFVNSDLKSMKDALNALEIKKGGSPEWGGRDTIIGSPQGKSSLISCDEIKELAKKYL